ncbi:type II TA system antitoxin MqsA family protein [Pseudoxanthomonas sp. Root630]|uniref:type II TA system antitoxin MqsA family protein n=1 Tax=Pseudoxanthomonas sp. Root630 TaxID=1736574 RepID=UPI000702D3F7|nr:type II TA system antitoxin MqsA family protein [Pseudoxanthomonas sp. Root630]KRA47584.1 hypothetical protein ASD72_20155 [Pseudoxanthomonas sp. Root630]
MNKRDNEGNAGAVLAAGQCPACGSLQALVAYRDETETVRVGDLAQEIHGMAGERCRVCGEAFADSDSTARWSTVANALVARSRSNNLRRTRLKLRLTQVQAGLLTGGGHNGFSRYETGKAQPSPAVVNLFSLLDKHPQLLRELPAIDVTAGNKRARPIEATGTKTVATGKRLRGLRAAQRQKQLATAQATAKKKKADEAQAVNVLVAAKKKGSSPKAGTPTPRRPVAPGRR